MNLYELNYSVPFIFSHVQIEKNTFDTWWPNEVRILATAGPAERLEFVRRIRSSPRGEVVAVTASGVNDDEVLRSADVGLTMVTTSNIWLFLAGMLKLL